MEINNPNPESKNNGQVPAPMTNSNKTKIYSAIGILLLIIVSGFIVLKYKLTSSPNNQAKNEPNIGFVSGYKETIVPLKDVPNYEAVKQKYGLKLTPAQEKYLNDNHFLLVSRGFAPGENFDEMLNDFDSLGGSSIINYRNPEDTKLVTPDIVLHAYHKFFEMTLEQLEQKELAQSLGDFLGSLQNNLLVASQNNTGLIQERYQNLLAQVTLARVLFENKSAVKPDSFSSPQQETAYDDSDKTVDSFENAKIILTKYSSGLTPELVTKIQIDLEAIYKASNVGVSPLFSQYSDTLNTDYTQYTPRSHYTKTSALRAYFRTMMYLGRSSYFLQKDIGITDSNLLAKQFTVKSVNGITPIVPWQKIMDVTGFYAGQSDDLTYKEWKDFETKTLGSALTDDASLSSQSTIQKMAENLNQLRLPKILSDVVVDDNIASQTKSDLLRKSLAFRIFGQRFSFDAWILNDLTAGEEKSEVKLPSTPSALFIPAAFGDLTAQKHTEQFLQQDAGFSPGEIQGFLTKLSQKKSDIGKVTKDKWFASMGSAWLYVLGSLTHDFGVSYPAYMQATPFLDKQIQAFLGSFTELKHDTLLYAKQSYAEKGGGGDTPDVPPVVKGFVEPNLDFWNRFNELIANTKEVFAKNNLFADSTVTARLQNFQDINNFYTSIATQELQGKTISDDNYEKLRTTTLSFMVQPFDSATDPDEDSSKVALIADIHTDAVKSQILYEAEARPYFMVAIVGNEQSPRAVAGLVYNHYEFTNPLGGQRLSDEDWKSWVYDQTERVPAKNFWYSSLQVK